LAEHRASDAHRSAPPLDRELVRRRVGERLGADVQVPLGDAQAVAVREPARSLAEHEEAAYDARALDELRPDQRAPVRAADLELRSRSLRRDAGPRHDGVALIAAILVEAAQVPAVVQLDHAPLVAVARALGILMLGEVVLRPLPVDPADLARH